jgi:hypothetical protein
MAPIPEFVSVRLKKILGVRDGWRCPKDWHREEHLPEKQVPATRPRDPARPEEEPRTSTVKRVNGGMTFSRFNDAAIEMPGEPGF